MDKYQLSAVPCSKALLEYEPTQFVVCMTGKAGQVNLPVAIQSLPSFSENVETNFARLCFPGDRECHGFTMTASWRRGYQFSEDDKNMSYPNPGLGQKLIHMVTYVREVFLAWLSNERPPLIQDKWLFTSCKHFAMARSTQQVAYILKGPLERETAVCSFIEITNILSLFHKCDAFIIFSSFHPIWS